MAFVKLIAIVCISMALVSCVESENPLSDIEKAKYDGSVAGVWKDTDKGTEFIHIGKGEKTNVMAAIVIDHAMDGTINPISVVMFPSVVNGINYMNVRPASNNQEAHGYYFFRYELVDKNTLKICTPKPDSLRDAVLQKKLKGDVSKFSAKITENTPNLVRYILTKDGEKIFSECNQYNRM